MHTHALTIMWAGMHTGGGAHVRKFTWSPPVTQMLPALVSETGSYRTWNLPSAQGWLASSQNPIVEQIYLSDTHMYPRMSFDF